MTYLSRDEFRVVYLTEKENVGENLQRLRFSLPEENTNPVGLSPCEYIGLKHGEEENYIRHYSVVSPVIGNTRYVDIVLKDKTRKRKSVMVDYLLSRKPTDEVLMKIGGGYQYKPNQYKNFGFIVGGSGASPAFQVLNEKIISKGEDKTKMYVLFGAPIINQLTHRLEFEKLRDENDDVSVHFTLDKAPTKEQLSEANLEEWRGLVGFATEEKIKISMPPPGKDTFIVCCGPMGMMKFLKGLLPKLGYTDEMTYFYM